MAMRFRLIRCRAASFQPRLRGFPAAGGLIGQSFQDWFSGQDCYIFYSLLWQPVSTGS